MNEDEIIHHKVVDFLVRESLISFCVMLAIWILVKLAKPCFSNEARSNFLLICAFVYVLFPLSFVREGWGSLYYHHLGFTRMMHFTCGLSLGYLAVRQVGIKGFKTWKRDKKLGTVVGILLLCVIALSSMPRSLF